MNIGKGQGKEGIMKLRTVLSWLSDLFNPTEIRRAKRLQKQWAELDDVASFIEVDNVTPQLLDTVEEGSDKLHTEMDRLLDRVASDIKRIKEITGCLAESQSKSQLQCRN